MLDQTYDSSFQVQKIVDEKDIAGQPHFLIKWKGYASDQNTWEPMRHLHNAKEKLKQWQCYKRKQINYLEYHRMIDKTQINQSTKRKQDQNYVPLKSKQNPMFKRQSSRPYNMILTKVNQNHSNQKMSIFDQVKSKKTVKSQKSLRKKKQLAIFQERLKSKPKIWEQYLQQPNKITQNCQQIKNVVAQAIKYHQKFIRKSSQDDNLIKSENKKLEIEQFTQSQDNITKIKFSSLQQKRTNFISKNKALKKLDKSQKEKLTQNEQFFKSQKEQDKVLVITSNKLNEKQNDRQKINNKEFSKFEVSKQLASQLNKNKAKKFKINALSVVVDTIKITQNINSQNLFTSQIICQNSEKLIQKNKQIVNNLQIQSDKQIHQSKECQTLSQSLKSIKIHQTRDKKNQQAYHQIQSNSCLLQTNKQQEIKNQNQFFSYEKQISLSSIQFLSQNLSHSVQTISDLQLIYLVHSHQDQYYQDLFNSKSDVFNSKIFRELPQIQIQNTKKQQNQKQNETISSEEINRKATRPCKILRLLICQGQTFAEIEFQSKINSQKEIKKINYKETKKIYPKLLVSYFEKYMLSS